MVKLSFSYRKILGPETKKAAEFCGLLMKLLTLHPDAQTGFTGRTNQQIAAHFME
tara:strand:+ start:232 stop:396 length:165 start_codon:yes stop_codon:yes gene_type:complete